MTLEYKWCSTATGGRDDGQNQILALQHTLSQKDVEIAKKDAEIAMLTAEVASLRAKLGITEADVVDLTDDVEPLPEDELSNNDSQKIVKRKSRKKRKRLRQVMARTGDHDSAKEQFAWVLDNNDNVGHVMVEWENGQKEVIPESRIREVDEDATSRPTRRSRRSSNNDNTSTTSTSQVKQENVGIKAEYDDATDDEEFAPKVSKPSIKKVKLENTRIKAEYDDATDDEEQTPKVRYQPKAGRDSNIRSLKPQFKKGAEIYAAYWDNDEREGTSSWYLGKIASSRVLKKSGKYGQTRLYSINFDDGDAIEDLEEHFVMAKQDYDLQNQKEWLGVRNETDDACNDNWAKIIGWYVADIDGEEVAFSYLSEAIRAYDDSIIRIHGAGTKNVQLNMPGNYPELFSQTSEHDEKSDQKEPAAAVITQSSSDEELVVATQTEDAHDEAELPYFPVLPGLNGAVAGVLTGTKFVLSGNWPELYDGRKERDFNKGKCMMEDIIKSFGGTTAKNITKREPPGECEYTKPYHMLFIGDLSPQAAAFL
jgi:hypothetical protein